ncbi:MAG: TetR/AcrR family transcriptional regulator [Anaerolineales bacterium]|nr:TetR/AcrR family transcriptional regulator [Anaerolineales bacterium]
MTELSPRQRRYHKTKETILQAAREIIAEKGSDGLSLRELARRIDYSPSGLYEYFSSKEEIVTAVCVEGLGLLSDYLNRAPANLTPAERLMEMGLAYLDFAREHPEHFRLIFASLSHEQTHLAEEAMNGDSPYHLLLEAVQAVIATGEFSVNEEFNLEDMAFSLWALVHGLAVLEQTHLKNFQQEAPTQLYRRALRVFGEGLKNKNFLPDNS